MKIKELADDLKGCLSNVPIIEEPLPEKENSESGVQIKLGNAGLDSLPGLFAVEFPGAFNVLLYTLLGRFIRSGVILDTLLPLTLHCQPIMNSW